MEVQDIIISLNPIEISDINDFMKKKVLIVTGILMTIINSVVLGIKWIKNKREEGLSELER